MLKIGILFTIGNVDEIWRFKEDFLKALFIIKVVLITKKIFSRFLGFLTIF